MTSKKKVSDEAKKDDINLNSISEALDESVGVSLPFQDIQDVAKFIKYNRPTNIVLLVGAGISTSAGIPDFRSDTGIYKSLSKYKLRDPQDIFSLDFFKRNPSPFYEVAKKILVFDVKPTLTHYFMRMLVEKNKVLRIYTQNIDMLEHIAGIQSEKIINAHGCHKTSTCLNCKVIYDQEYIENHLRFGKDIIARCNKCKTGVIKPDITFFGEGLPEVFEKNVLQDLPNADMLIILGTSLKVFPVAGIPCLVSKDTPRVLFNDESVGQGILTYHQRNNKTDLFAKGKTDDLCRELAAELGWLPELDKLMKAEHKKLDEKYKKLAEKSKCL